MAYCCLNYQATNEYLKSTTLHFSNNLKSPVEHILLTTCHLAPFPIKEGRKTITHKKGGFCDISPVMPDTTIYMRAEILFSLLYAFHRGVR